MGHREVRPVPLDWEHPQSRICANGEIDYIPLHSRADLRFRVKFYEENPEYAGEWEYNPADYMPVIPEGTPLGWQLYETITEGTPVSPVFGTLEELAGWCEDGATVFAGMRWSREQWLATFRRGSLDTDSLLYVEPGAGVHVGDPLKREEKDSG